MQVYSNPLATPEEEEDVISFLPDPVFYEEGGKDNVPAFMHELKPWCGAVILWAWTKLNQVASCPERSRTSLRLLSGMKRTENVSFVNPKLKSCSRNHAQSAWQHCCHMHHLRINPCWKQHLDKGIILLHCNVGIKLLIMFFLHISPCLRFLWLVHIGVSYSI